MEQHFLARKPIALARIQWGGEPIVFASGAGFVGNPDKLRWQYETQSRDDLRLEFARKLICDKLRNSLVTLQSSLP
ncbi:hypothetical protein [Erythrobacter fulvus]|uniref:hypothetical protein n=1 Tax=Erythrobacter fulvus TaxID=2987523 RepID=UPI0023595236|nr:hypothetical protein [Erythrobacter fulvus]